MTQCLLVPVLRKSRNLIKDCTLHERTMPMKCRLAERAPPQRLNGSECLKDNFAALRLPTG